MSASIPEEALLCTEESISDPVWLTTILKLNIVAATLEDMNEAGKSNKINPMLCLRRNDRWIICSYAKN